MADDAFGGHEPTLVSPPDRHAAVTAGPDDLDPIPRGLFIGGAGDITITDAAGTSVQYAVQAGQILPFRARKVTAATATGIVAWW